MSHNCLITLHTWYWRRSEPLRTDSVCIFYNCASFPNLRAQISSVQWLFCWDRWVTGKLTKPSDLWYVLRMWVHIEAGTVVKCFIVVCKTKPKAVVISILVEFWHPLCRMLGTNDCLDTGTESLIWSLELQQQKIILCVNFLSYIQI